MSYQEYTVKVWDNGDRSWYQNDKLHRIDGPAIEYANGAKSWYIDGKEYSETDFNKEITKRNQPSCNGKIVEIDGKKYALTEVV